SDHPTVIVQSQSPMVHRLESSERGPCLPLVKEGARTTRAFKEPCNLAEPIDAGGHAIGPSHQAQIKHDAITEKKSAWARDAAPITGDLPALIDGQTVTVRIGHDTEIDDGVGRIFGVNPKTAAEDQRRNKLHFHVVLVFDNGANYTPRLPCLEGIE